MDEVRQMHRLFLDLYFSALDAAHIQHIIDEESRCWLEVESFSGSPAPAPYCRYGSRPESEADDGVHWGADIVAHVEQELPLGAVCRPLVLGAISSLQLVLFLS